MVSQSEGVEGILEQFTGENVRGSIPVIDEAGQLAVREYFEENNLVMIGGHLSVSSAVPSIEKLLRPEQKDILRRNPNAIVGPYFFGDDYYPAGIGFWDQLTTASAQDVESSSE